MPKQSSVNQLVREYLEQLAGKSDPNEAAEPFSQLSRISQGDSRGWKFDRGELHGNGEFQLHTVRGRMIRPDLDLDTTSSLIALDDERAYARNRG